LILPIILWNAIALNGLSGYREQFPLPNTTVPDGWGVNIHFTDPAPGEMQMIADAGFKWVRMDLFWHHIETKKGVYDFSAYDRLMASLKQHKIRPIFILDYGNDLYQSGSPREPQSIAGFCNYVRAAVKRYRGQGVVWEMWNEPNIFFWQPKPNVKEYIALATAVGKTIREEAPEEWYVGPATSGFDFSFLNKCFEAGLLKYWDAVTVHPYRTTAPETVVGDWAKLKELVKKYEPNREIPLISGEWGYSEKYSGLSLEKQSQYIVRQYLTNLSCGVGLSIWYDWKNDGTDEKEVEHHFGTVYHDLKPKPTYFAVKAIVDELRGYSFAMRLRQNDPNDWILLFKDAAGKAKAIGWTTSPEGTSKLKLDPMPRRIRPDQLPDAYVVRAAEATKLPERAVVESSRDLTRLIAPLVANLREGERLKVQDDAPQDAPSADRAIVLRKNDTRKLETMLKGLKRLSDIITPMRTLSVSLTSPGIPDVVQACDMVRPILQFTVVGYDGGGLILKVDNQRKPFKGSVQWLSGPSVPVHIKTGVNKIRIPSSLPSSLGMSAEIALLDEKGRLVSKLFEGKQLHFLPVDSGTWKAVPEGDPKIAGSATVRVTDAPIAKGAKKALGIDYKLDQGWKYLCVRNDQKQKTDLPGKPVSLTMRIKGDGSGCALKLRLVDSTGQTHQIDGVDMYWTDAQYVTFDLTKIAVSWGGKNDGRLHYPLRFDTVLLIDGKGKESKGYVEISDLVITYERSAGNSQ